MACPTEGGRGICNQPFNVQINLANTGTAPSTPGNLTLQDVNIHTGDVTFTGLGAYPSINPGGNFVVVIPVRTEAFYNEDHELRAFTNGRQFTIRYSLEQGNCNITQGPTQLPSTSRSFAAGECTIQLNSSTSVRNVPNGSIFASLDAGTIGNCR